MNALESLAYAIARGVARAWLDVVAERAQAVEEKPTAEDRRRAERFRDTVRLPVTKSDPR